MLKLIFVAFFITGYKCTGYHDKADKEYIEKTITKTNTFPEVLQVLNSDPQEFQVTRENDEIFFEPAYEDKALSLQTEYGTMVLVGFKFSFQISGTVIVIQFNMDHKYLRQLFIRLRVYSPPTTDELQEHAKTHALNVPPLTKENVLELTSQTDKKMRQVKLSVQWILDLLNHKKKPLFSPYFEDGLFVYLSPPTVMNLDLLTPITHLTRDMDSTPGKGSSVDGEEMLPFHYQQDLGPPTPFTGYF